MRKLLIISMLFLAGCYPVQKIAPEAIKLPDTKGIVQIYARIMGPYFVIMGGLPIIKIASPKTGGANL